MSTGDGDARAVGEAWLLSHIVQKRVFKALLTRLATDVPDFKDDLFLQDLERLQVHLPQALAERGSAPPSHQRLAGEFLAEWVETTQVALGKAGAKRPGS